MAQTQGSLVWYSGKWYRALLFILLFPTFVKHSILRTRPFTFLKPMIRGAVCVRVCVCVCV